jgi:DNA replication protein DnaC
MISKELKHYFEQHGILSKWHEKTLDEYHNDEDAKDKILAYLKNHKQASKQGVGPYLHGANGVGKTHLMMTAFMQLFNEHRYKVQVVSLTTLVDIFTSSWYDEGKKALLDSMKNCHFLGIEEIGKQIDSEKSVAIVTHILETVLRYRLQSNKPTWFTSNIDPSEIKNIYNEDIASMLRECSVDIAVVGNDKRKEIYTRNKKLFR